MIKEDAVEMKNVLDEYVGARCQILSGIYEDMKKRRDTLILVLAPYFEHVYIESETSPKVCCHNAERRDGSSDCKLFSITPAAEPGKFEVETRMLPVSKFRNAPPITDAALYSWEGVCEILSQDLGSRAFAKSLKK